MGPDGSASFLVQRIYSLQVNAVNAEREVADGLRDLASVFVVGISVSYQSAFPYPSVGVPFLGVLYL